MKQLSRVVWQEGMHLAPHHFQAQKRYFEDLIDFTSQSLYFAGFGFAGLAWSEEALANGRLELLHARGIFPDGLAFAMPESDALPTGRAVADLLSPVAREATVYLVLPPYQPGGANCVNAETRFQPAQRKLVDENAGIEERPVVLGQKNFRLLLEHELSPGVSALPIGRIMRDGAGNLVFDPNFIPPLVTMEASPRLIVMVKRLVEILESKAMALRPERASAKLGGMSQRDVASFWYLHCINSSIADLRHMAFVKKGHPEELYRLLLKLGGALCTFNLGRDPGELPLYDHLRPENCFPQIDAHIRQALETILPSASLQIPLRQYAPYLYEGEIVDERCLAKSRWILGVRAQTAESVLILRVPQLVKVCSQDFIERLVQSAFPGLELLHMPIAPAEIQTRTEMQYFSISRTGACWQQIMKTKRVGVYVPGEFPQPEVELIVILEA
ncbi:MAG: type VI secretion system baseplate subunit TssK [Bryobacter sp.]|nr:type VI secretion system baseplate subunit TssK [Bryobacter sp.]